MDDYIYLRIKLGGRLYRYSRERRVSGRPASIQYMDRRSEWRDVRNVDVSDRIWLIADEPERGCCISGSGLDGEPA